MICLVGQIRNIKPENPNNTTQISVKKPIKMKQKTEESQALLTLEPQLRR